MKLILSYLFVFWLSLAFAVAQSKSPDQFLEYRLGSRFSYHNKIVDYFRHVEATSSGSVKLLSYGKTYEGRELLVAIISSKENMAKLEKIRLSNLNLAKGSGLKTSGALKDQPAILWMSYNVHGNEASSAETAMKTLYALCEGKEQQIAAWLKNTVVIIDPCLNPDGRERYVNYYNAVAGKSPNPNPEAREHFEPWPGGRSNHYYFDLNRDWAWQSQVESRQRVALYQQWMPEVHIDFHEQSYNEPYYFAPAAEPVHQEVTAWQREFQVLTGKNNARYFDEQGWQYFTKERFDLLYPAYGDTYPLYNGAIGMTYEQGGIRAGLAVITSSGDTLTLKDRIDHHYTTGLSTLETVSNYSVQLLSEFSKYFEQSVINPPGAFETYVIKGDNRAKMRKLELLLQRNHIEFSYGLQRKFSGFNFETQKIEPFEAERNDMIINLHQSRSVLASVLLEPHTALSDSNTYDITAWSLPYAYGLTAYALKESVKGSFSSAEDEATPMSTNHRPYAWVLRWESSEDALVLIALQKAGVKVRASEEAFSTAGRNFEAGTLLIYRAENERTIKTLGEKLSDISARHKKSFTPIASGYVDKGKDLGSSVYKILAPPKIAIVSGSETTPQSVGEIWHFFEQELNYPVTMIESKHLSNLDLHKINVLIVPDGSYQNNFHDKVGEWIHSGGKIILIEDAISTVEGKKPFEITKKAPLKEPEKTTPPQVYAGRNADNHDESIPGAIFKVNLDLTHPLSLGLGKVYYTLKTDHKIYEPLKNGWTVGRLNPQSFVSGLAGKSAREKLNNGMLFGVQHSGKGTIVYLGANVMFRSFWENGKQMMLNAVFMVN